MNRDLILVLFLFHVNRLVTRCHGATLCCIPQVALFVFQRTTVEVLGPSLPVSTETQQSDNSRMWTLGVSALSVLSVLMFLKFLHYLAVGIVICLALERIHVR